MTEAQTRDALLEAIRHIALAHAWASDGQTLSDAIIELDDIRANHPVTYKNLLCHYQRQIDATAASERGPAIARAAWGLLQREGLALNPRGGHR